MHVRRIHDLLGHKIPHASCMPCCYRSHDLRDLGQLFASTRTTQLQSRTQPLSLAPDHSPSLSSVDVWRRDSAGCYTRRCFSTCRPQRSISHLPASLRRTANPSEAIGARFAWLSSLRRARRADRVAAPLRAFRHAHLMTPSRHVLLNFGPRYTEGRVVGLIQHVY